MPCKIEIAASIHMETTESVSTANDQKKSWEKPMVTTHGDAVDIIKADKYFNLDDGNAFSGQCNCSE